MSSSQGPNPRGQDADGVAGLLGQRWGVPEGLHLGLRTGVGSTDRLSTNAPTVRNPQRVRVVLGAHRLQTPEPTQQRLGISRLFENNYNPQEKLNDVLLLQLSEKAVLGPAVQLLPWQREDRDVAAGTLCDVAGWGVVSHTGRKPDRLQHLLLPVLDRATCNLRTYHDGTITERMMCAESNRRDTCKGDSGGPLVCGSVAEGVVTSGSRICGNHKKPGIYTRLASYVSWIDGTITERMMCAESNRRDTCKGDSGGPLVCGSVAEGVVTSGSRICGNHKKPGIYTRLASYVSWIDGVMAEGAAA
uniref:Complement factor D n=1 Tax=Bos mutus grunniens TaxID=30521 RepID=A0A8B9WTG6_BOSMU